MLSLNPNKGDDSFKLIKPVEICSDSTKFLPEIEIFQHRFEPSKKKPQDDCEGSKDQYFSG